MFEVFETLDPEIRDWVVIPLVIFIARIFDVMLSTVRIILVVNDKRGAASILSFFEIILWLIAVGQTLQHLSNVMSCIAFAGGFAMGTFLGMKLERYLAIGQVMIRIVTVQKDAYELTQALRAKNYKITSIDAEGATGKVNILYSAINRKQLKPIVETIKQFNPNAFYTIENLKYLNQPEEITNSALINFWKNIKLK